MFRYVATIAILSSVAAAESRITWPPRAPVQVKPSNQKPVAVVTHDCDVDGGYELEFTAQKPTIPELIDVGVYQSHAPGGTFTLAIDRPGQVYLRLNAYDATTWKIVPSKRTNIVAIQVEGYHEQKVLVGSGTTVFQTSYDVPRSRSGPDRKWPSNITSTSGAYCYSMSKLSLR
jgi:hypothetical protein